MGIWNSDTCADWNAALDRYPEVVRAQGVNGLDELDAWFRVELPGLIVARKPAYVTHTELERVATWKMKRGVWRERNRLLVIGNTPASVKKASREAFAAVPDLREPISILSTLAGVGPATASAVLASHSPALFPFFDELVAEQIPGLGKVAFTAAYYQRYAEALRDRADRLNTHCKRRKWTAHAVSQALWSASGGKVAHGEDKRSAS